MCKALSLNVLIYVRTISLVFLRCHLHSHEYSLLCPYRREKLRLQQHRTLEP